MIGSTMEASKTTSSPDLSDPQVTFLPSEKRDIHLAKGRIAKLIVSSHEGVRGSPLQRDDTPAYLSGTQDGGTASSWASVFTLCNSAIGAGVLSLPFAFQSAGERLESKLGASMLACANTCQSLV